MDPINRRHAITAGIWTVLFLASLAYGALVFEPRIPVTLARIWFGIEVLRSIVMFFGAASFARSVTEPWPPPVVRMPNEASDKKEPEDD